MIIKYKALFPGVNIAIYSLCTVILLSCVVVFLARCLYDPNGYSYSMELV